MSAHKKLKNRHVHVEAASRPYKACLIFNVNFVERKVIPTLTCRTEGLMAIPVFFFKNHMCFYGKYVKL